MLRDKDNFGGHFTCNQIQKNTKNCFIRKHDKTGEICKAVSLFCFIANIVLFEAIMRLVQLDLAPKNDDQLFICLYERNHTLIPESFYMTIVSNGIAILRIIT